MEPFRFVRVYSDERGDSHFDEQSLAMTLTDLAPPGCSATGLGAAGGFGLRGNSIASGLGRGQSHIPLPAVGWCTAFRVVSGSLQPTARRGHSGPGDAIMLTDTTGKGHVTEVTSSVPVNCVMIALA